MTSQFFGSNLRTARLFNALSLQDLGDYVGSSKQYLSRLESGVDAPSATLEAALASHLRVTPEFFRFADPMPIAEEQCHFRKQLTTKVALKQVARAKGEMLKRLVGFLDDRLELPKYSFIEADPDTPEHIEAAAEKSRSHWSLGLGPISNMTRVAENAGAVVMPLAGLASEIDAISFATRRPVIVTNVEGRSACRTRFGLAHEIGHFCLHVGVQTGDKVSEAQANRFASAFLMPRRYFAVECQNALRGSRFNWQVLADIKLRWGVSKAAILYRGRQLGVFSDDQYRSGVIKLNRHSEAISEVEDAAIPSERGEVISEGLRVLQQTAGLSRSSIARLMYVTPQIVDELLGHSVAELTHSNVVMLRS
jgi:Zn-dependent peptidase ImmA (M78 family)/transcriptional regulator with XRE-family HTH domain